MEMSECGSRWQGKATNIYRLGGLNDVRGRSDGPYLRWRLFGLYPPKGLLVVYLVAVGEILCSLNQHNRIGGGTLAP